MKVFWSRCGYRYGNFGDKLTPLFLDFLKLPYEWAPPEEADLIGIGSLLEKIPDNFKGVVWSTGSMFETTRKNLSQAKILAVRGNLTLKTLGMPPCIALGDGGLLCDFVSSPASKKFNVGILPHFVDQQDGAVRKLASRHPDISIIDVCAPTIDVIEQVAACECILSSSLHGLILADSLGVPNQWVEFSSSAEAITGARFKFRDYYSNFGLEAMEPLRLSGNETLDFLLKLMISYERPNISTVKAGLRESLKELAIQFGGNIHDHLSLEELRRKERGKSADRLLWNQKVAQLVFLLEKLLPPKERFVLIDEEQIRAEVTHAPAIPLIGENGVYWGAPSSDSHAIEKAQQHRSEGVRHMAIAQHAFWWLEEYPQFTLWLDDHAERLYSDQSLILFRFR